MLPSDLTRLAIRGVSSALAMLCCLQVAAGQVIKTGDIALRHDIQRLVDAGIDIRWAATLFGRPLAVYGQFIGEDEAGGLPSRYLGQLGLETSGVLVDRWFAEFAGTGCRFHRSPEIFNCAYNHTIYETGYRYRSWVLGHAADNDARMVSTGLILLNDQDTQWSVLVRAGSLNRGGAADESNSLTPTRQDVASLDLTHSRVFTYGRIEIGLGLEQTDDQISDRTSTDGRAFLQWRSSH